MTSLIRGLCCLLALAVLPLASGCDREGPLEKAGEQIDEAVEDAGEGIQDMGDDIEDTGDDAARGQP